MGYHPVTGPSWYRFGGGRRSSDRLKSSSWADSLSRFKDEHGHIAPVLRPSSICIAARDATAIYFHISSLSLLFILHSYTAQQV